MLFEHLLHVNRHAIGFHNNDFLEGAEVTGLS